MAPDLASYHHMALVCLEVVEDVASVSDDQAAPAPVDDMDIFLEQGRDLLPHQVHVFEVDTTLRFIQHEEIRLLDLQLQDFAPFDLTAGEPDIDVPGEEFFHVDQLSKCLDSVLTHVGCSNEQFPEL